MHSFKIRTGVSNIHEINKYNFERITEQQKPFYISNERNERVQFAVCPACDNPIEIIGLYKQLKNTDRPFGRHYKGDIKNLAKYNQQAYDYCPYSNNKITVTCESRKPKLTDYEKSIYNLMRDQFDRVVYVLSKELDIKITHSVAKKMLTTFVKGEGWLYPWATLNNLPWVFGHLTWSKSLYRQPVFKESSLYSSILHNCPAAEFVPSDFYNEYNIVFPKKDMFLDLNYCIINHKRNINDDTLTETMEFIVSDGGIGDNIVVFNKLLTIDEKYFMNLINLPQDKCYRNQKLIDIAKELMPELL